MKQFKGRLEKDRDQLYYYHIIIPDDIVQHFKSAKVTRLQIQYNDEVTVSGGMISAGNGQYFLIVNKELRMKFGWNAGSEMIVKLKPDESKYGMPMPEELAEALALDPEVDQLFHALTPGKQRNLIYLVSKPKGVETRIKKAVVIMQHLKDVRGKLDFKMLNEAYKNYGKMN